MLDVAERVPRDIAAITWQQLLFVGALPVAAFTHGVGRGKAHKVLTIVTDVAPLRHSILAEARSEPGGEWAAKCILGSLYGTKTGRRYAEQ